MLRRGCAGLARAGRALLVAVSLSVSLNAGQAAVLDPAVLLADPSAADWKSLEEFSGTLTRAQFEQRLHEVFDPHGGLLPFLLITDQSVSIYDSPMKTGAPLATITFASSPETCLAGPRYFRPPDAFRHGVERFPLAGVRIVIEPADIGGDWGKLEDRSTIYPGYGRIQEGDLTLLVGKVLEAKLRALGADVYITREGTQPISGIEMADVERIAGSVISQRPYRLPEAFRKRAGYMSASNPAYVKVASQFLLTKNLETLSRAENSRRRFRADLTIVLQFDATPRSCHARLTDINRNIFFVEGAYTASELGNDSCQRWKLLTKLLQNVTPTERLVATNIARSFEDATGYPPVLYGDTAVTRAVGDTPYVVARNLAFNREHDGPVVITEPYFMNQRVTLLRILAGDYPGIEFVAGQMRESIFREYADAIARGLVNAYGPD